MTPSPGPASNGAAGSGSARIGLVVAALATPLLLVCSASAQARQADCQPVKAVFYTSSDWWRLAQALAANPSACAGYYITVASLASDKTQMRPGAAAMIRALGPSFHALADVNYSAWQNRSPRPVTRGIKRGRRSCRVWLPLASTSTPGKHGS